jgi:hypothetical protein
MIREGRHRSPTKRGDSKIMPCEVIQMASQWQGSLVLKNFEPHPTVEHHVVDSLEPVVAARH